MKPENPYKKEHCNWCGKPLSDCYDNLCGDLQDCIKEDAWDEGYEACANQPISEQEGWIDFNDEHPTKDGYYLVKTPDFYKNCEFIVAEWSNHAERFYEEAFDNPIEVKKYKLIYTT